jgi:hypothetical protein
MVRLGLRAAPRSAGRRARCPPAAAAHNPALWRTPSWLWGAFVGRFGGARTHAAGGGASGSAAGGGACAQLGHTRACAAAADRSASGVLLQPVLVPAHGRAVVWLSVSGAIDSEEPMHGVLARAPSEARAWFGRKERRFRALQRTARVVVPAADAQLARMHEWSKCARA